MKKLLITASTFPRWENDTEPRFVLDYAKAMGKYYEVTVLAPSAPGALNREVLEGVQVIRYHYFPIHKLETLCYPGAIMPRIKEKKIRALLVPFLLIALWFNLLKIKDRFDYTHAHWFVPQGLVHGLFKNKFIISGLGGDVSSLNTGLFGRFKGRTVKKASHIMVVSKDLKEILLEKYEVDENKIDVIPLGCDVNIFSPERRIDNLWGQGDKKVILFVGRLVEKKGLEYLIDAMKGLDAKLVVVGNGPLQESIAKKISNMDEDICMVGSKTKKDLIDMYASCDIFCIPSVIASDGDKDGLPVALIEAMACGAPIVGTNLGGIEEVITNGENGILVEQKDVKGIHDALEMLLKNDDERTRLSLAARQTAINYDFDRISLKYKDIIETYIG